ncbi:MAG: hypothetical protein M1818_008335 [Claussenomyces sp. TS43310]|nr:MAG: hypothetical protein M1818_008335 [Claussenomyces sp. TS43310]
MLEYFTEKKSKKHQAEKRAAAGIQASILNEADENFLEHIISAEGMQSPLPECPSHLDVLEVDELVDDKAESDKKDKGKGKVDEKEKKKKSGKKKDEDLQQTNPVVMTDEAEREEEDISKVLDDINLAVVKNRAISISKQS